MYKQGRFIKLRRNIHSWHILAFSKVADPICLPNNVPIVSDFVG